MGLGTQKRLTYKEQAFVRNLVIGKNLTESALAAGYSGKHPGQSGWQALKNIQLKMPELFDRYGLTDEALIEKHLKPLLSATETKFVHAKGKITDMLKVPANAIRLDALNMAFRLKGSYAAPASENGTKKCVQVIVAPPPAKI
jgi:Terminase small subunit